jgi:glyoxylase-like metal-dependent hydrolase (beta-lactamase superfamily II)
LTHHHFDHILGSSVFTDAAIYAAPEVPETMSKGVDPLRTEAVSYGADVPEIDRAC